MEATSLIESIAFVVADPRVSAEAGRTRDLPLAQDQVPRGMLAGHAARKSVSYLGDERLANTAGGRLARSVSYRGGKGASGASRVSLRLSGPVALLNHPCRNNPEYKAS